MDYVMQASALVDPEQPKDADDSGSAFRGVRSTEQPPPSPLDGSGLVPWVREGMHVSDYVSVYAEGAGRQVRLEFIAHNANKAAAELAAQGQDELAAKHQIVELEACKILMDDLKQACQTMVHLYGTYLEADGVSPFVPFCLTFCRDVLHFRHSLGRLLKCRVDLAEQVCSRRRRPSTGKVKS